MQDFKTNAKKVYGLGSANAGIHHWVQQKFTAIFNVILVAWLLCTLTHISSMGYYEIKLYLSSLWNVVFASLFAVNVFFHAKLGLQVVIEDYIPNHTQRTVCLVLMNIAIYIGMVAALFAIFKIAF